jgi:WD40 repeat protein
MPLPDEEVAERLRLQAVEAADRGDTAALRRVLLDVRWLTWMINNVGWPELDDSLALLSEDSVVRALRALLRTHAHRFGPIGLRPPSLLTATIMDVVADDPDVSRALAATERRQGGQPLLRSAWPAAPEPTEFVLPTEGRSSPVSLLLPLPDARELVVGDEQGGVRIYDVRDRRYLHRHDGHGAAITDGDVSPAATLVATADEKGAVRLWDADSGDLRTQLAGTPWPVRECRFGRDGTRIYTSRGVEPPIRRKFRDEPSLVRIWDTATGDELARLVGPHEVDNNDVVGSLRVSSDGQLVIGEHLSLFGASTTCVWTADGTLLHHRPGLSPLGASPDPVAAASPGPADLQLLALDQGRLVTWDAATNTVLADHGRPLVLDPPSQPLVTRLGNRLTRQQVSYDLFATFVDRRTWRYTAVWNKQTTIGETLRFQSFVACLDPGQAGVRMLTLPDEIVAGAINPDGGALAMVTRGGSFVLWSPDDGARLRDEPAAHPAPPTGVAFASDGRWVATSDRAGTVRIWATGTTSATPRARLERGGAAPVPAGAGPVDAGPMRRCATATSANLIVTAGDTRDLHLWDASNGRRLGLLYASEHVTFVNMRVWTCIVAPDGRWVAAADASGTVYLWADPTGAARRAVCSGHTGQVVAAATPGDADVLATVDHRGQIRVWDVDTGHATLKAEPPGPPPPVGENGLPVEQPLGTRCCTFDSTGRWLAVSRVTGQVDLWTRAAGRGWAGPRPGPAGAAVTALAPGPAATVVIGRFDGTVELWDPAHETSRVALPAGGGAVRQVICAPDGSWLAAALEPDADAYSSPAASAIRVVPLAGGTPNPDGPSLSVDRWYVARIAPSADSRWLAGVGGKATGIWDVHARGAEPVGGLILDDRADDLAWLGNPSRLVVTGNFGVRTYTWP